MLTVEEAYAAIIDHFAPLQAECVPASEALDRVLTTDVIAASAVPPFANSAMDGYAVRVADLAAAGPDSPVTLRVVGDVPAGKDPVGLVVEPGTAIRIMTGAPLPAGTEAVVMREDTREGATSVEVLTTAEDGENIRLAGEDIAIGQRVLEAGMRLKPAALGVLAAIDVMQVKVVARPRVAILGTGDELVAPGTPLAPGQVRASSLYALEALVRQMGAIPVMGGIAPDERLALRQAIEAGAAASHLLLTTGGVSVGDHDLVREILGEVGQVDFWRVNMQPGKPLAFGHVRGTPVIGLPGNPVSTLVAFELFVRPAIRRLQGHADPRPRTLTASLAASISKRSPRRQYLRARVTWEGGGYQAALTGAQGSHMITSMLAGNALLILPEGPGEFAAGDAVSFLWLEGG